jgi:glycosyltransferase involved in cell wall biosynthesis
MKSAAASTMKRTSRTRKAKDRDTPSADDRRRAGRPSVSVVIGIRDWGVERLEQALKSHKKSYADDAEVVVSDFGSADPKPIRRLCKALSCRYVYTQSDIWSRSRALNVGLSAATSDFLVTTDSDIVFSPTTLPLVVERLRSLPTSIQLVQCRDLPEGVDPAAVTWDEMRDLSTLRPRWGMGGLAAFSRDTFDRIRGFDERMEVWGAEDRDFVKRAQAFGSPVEWIDDPSAAIFHLWHPPFLQTSRDAATVFNRNHALLNEDHTIVRNRVGATCGRFGSPIVSVVIATYNRADRLGSAIRSCLDQSVDDIEVVVWDDGSSDATQEVLSGFDDRRLRIFRSEANCGLPATRNKANAIARGTFIAIHDDDDLMLPNRLEAQLDVLDHASQGSYGGWVDWDEDALETQFYPGAAELSLPGLLFNARMLLHPTVLVRADVMRAYSYEESFRAGSDYNLLLRMIRDGICLVHCGKYLILRTIHSSNMTKGNAGVQKSSAKVTHSAMLNMIDARTEKSLRDSARKVSPYPIDEASAQGYIQQLLPRHEVEFYKSLPPAAAQRGSFVEEFAIEGGLPRQISVYSIEPAAQAEVAGTVSRRELAELSPEEGIAVQLLRQTAGQVVRCQLDGGAEAALTGLRAMAVDGEPLYLVRQQGTPSAVLFACKTKDEAEIRSRKALRLRAISRVDTLSA